MFLETSLDLYWNLSVHGRLQFILTTEFCAGLLRARKHLFLFVRMRIHRLAIIMSYPALPPTGSRLYAKLFIKMYLSYHNVDIIYILMLIYTRSYNKHSITEYLIDSIPLERRFVRWFAQARTTLLCRLRVQ